jgi:hypothetical protein
MRPTSEWKHALAAQWRATTSGPFFDLADPPSEFVRSLPEDYLATVGEFGGREGFLGESYLRLYRLQELPALNLAYQVPELSPEIIVFGSNGGGEALAFSLDGAGVVEVPFIPLSIEHAERRAPTFGELISGMAAVRSSPASAARLVGSEIHEIKPICLGGSPTDPTNKAVVPVSQHAELCRFWNKVYRRLVPEAKAR